MAEHRNLAIARDDGEIRLLTIIAVIFDQWKLILRDLLVVAIVVIGIWAVFPKSYTARTTLVLPPEQSDPRSQLASQLPAGVRGLIGGGGGGNNKQQLVTAILNSRSLADSIILGLARDRPDSLEVKEEVGEILMKRTQVSTTKEDAFQINVTAGDNHLAARVAAAFPPAVNAIAAAITTDAAARQQAFLEQQLSEAANALLASEQQLLDFQSAADAPALKEQAERTVEAAAELQREVLAREVQVAQMRRTLTPGNPELVSAEAELAAWRAQLRRLTGGQRRGVSDVFLALGGTPELQVAATRLAREYEKNEQIFISLTAALAQTRIDSRNDLPVVSVLDAPLVPRQPSSPGLKIVLLAAVLLGGVVAVIAAFIRAYARHARRDPANEPFFDAVQRFKSDIQHYILRRAG